MAKSGVKKVDIATADNIVDLKAKERISGGFKVSRIDEDHQEYESHQLTPAEEREERMQNFAEKLEEAVVKVAPAEARNLHNVEPKELIKVKFAKFVQLVASRDFLSVLEKNQDEDIIISSNLLTDLAGSVDEKGEKKVPVVFLIGLAIGVVLTYILISK